MIYDFRKPLPPIDLEKIRNPQKISFDSETLFNATTGITDTTLDLLLQIVEMFKTINYDGAVIDCKDMSDCLELLCTYLNTQKDGFKILDEEFKIRESKKQLFQY